MQGGAPPSLDQTARREAGAGARSDVQGRGGEGERGCLLLFLKRSPHRTPT